MTIHEIGQRDGRHFIATEFIDGVTLREQMRIQELKVSEALNIAVQIAEVGLFGSLGRGSIRGPSTKNLDFSVVKNWRIHDRYGLQFRAEMFNAFNHTNFNGIDAGLDLDEVAGDENFGRPLNPNFGRLTATRGPREIQFGVKFNF